VEGLPAAGISSSGLLFVALPLSYAVRFARALGAWTVDFAVSPLLSTWVGDHRGVFCGPCTRQAPLCAAPKPKKTWEGAIASMAAALLVGWLLSTRINVPAPVCPWTRRSGKHSWTGWRFARVGV